VKVAAWQASLAVYWFDQPDIPEQGLKLAGSGGAFFFAGGQFAAPWRPHQATPSSKQAPLQQIDGVSTPLSGLGRDHASKYDGLGPPPAGSSRLVKGLR